MYQIVGVKPVCLVAAQEEDFRELLSVFLIGWAGSEEEEEDDDDAVPELRLDKLVTVMEFNQII